MSGPLLPGTLLKNGTYQIRGLCRIGGQSIVYESTITSSCEIVIIKENQESDTFSDEALRQEFEILQSISHRGLPKAVDWFVENHRSFLVMTYVHGSDLDDLLRRRGRHFNWLDVVCWAEQLLDILMYLQGREPVIIHRDINPRNIRVTPDNVIYLIDFGIAKRSNSRTLLVGGTPHYASPEQLNDEGTDCRSDLYSLAATVHYLMTGIAPHDSRLRETTLLKGLYDPLVPVNAVVPEIPLGIAELLTQAMSLDREHRPSNAFAMSAALKRATTIYSSDAENTLASEQQRPPYDGSEDTLLRERIRRIVVNVAHASDATIQARRLIDCQNIEGELGGVIVQLIVDLLDRKPEERRELITHYSALLPKQPRGHLRDALTLVYQLVYDAPIEADARIQLREHLARYLADHTLSNMKGRSRQEIESLDIEGELSEEHYLSHMAQRKFSKRVLLWGARGALLALLIQISLGILTAHHSLFGASGVLVSIAHITAASLAFLTIMRIRQRLRYHKRGWGACLVSFCSGAFLAAIIYQDILLAITSITDLMR